MKIQTALIATLAIICSAPASAEEISLIHAGKLMDVPGQSVKTGQTIIVRDGVIVSVENGYLDPTAVAVGEEDTVLIHDLSDMFVLPGLIDGHVHITGEIAASTKTDIVERSDADTAMFGAVNARITLDAGFTTVRDLNGRGQDAVFALRDAINMGYVPGPRLYAAGHSISPTGGHGQRSGYSDEIFQVLRKDSVCDGPAECRRAVREQVRRSADQIKFVATGGVLTDSNSGTGQQFFDDELQAIIETAHSMGRKVTAHAHDTVGVNSALRAGVDSIEHGTYANEESFRLFKENGAYLVPTILAGVTVAEIAEDPNSFFSAPVRVKALQVGPSLIEMTRRAHDAGVSIAFGTDSAVSAHGQNAREFVLLVEAGLTPTEAILTATVNGADNLGMSDRLGTLEAGKWADVIAVDGDPTQNISELMDIDFVMKDGIVYKSE